MDILTDKQVRFLSRKLGRGYKKEILREKLYIFW